MRDEHSVVKEVSLDTQRLHRHYQTCLKKVMSSVEELPEGYSLLPSDHCFYIQYPEQAGICTVPYEQMKPKCNPAEGRPDWRNVIYFWLKKIKREDLADQFREEMASDW